jgi:hypothetical protein
MLYTIIDALTKPELITKVVVAIGQGWKPIGGLAFYSSLSEEGHHVYFAQAMIKESL